MIVWRDAVFRSDATAFMDITRTSIVLEDGQWAQVKRGDKMFSIRNMQQEEQAVNLETIIGDISLVEKGGFDHHMIKEITRQPDSLSNCLRGRVSADGRVHLGGLCAVINHNGRQVVPLDAIRAARQVRALRAAVLTPRDAAPQITICACGTSWHAALVGEYLLETLANIRVEVEYASEFRYRRVRADLRCRSPRSAFLMRRRSAPMNKEDDVVIVISQSGETADTLAALRLAKSKVRAPTARALSPHAHQGVLVIGVCNAVGSTIARETDAGVYLHAGPEIGVASTKAFTAQVAPHFSSKPSNPESETPFVL
jgi:glucosamine--fructose-6-phosphate aminotransferase (isomerizing)